MENKRCLLASQRQHVLAKLSPFLQAVGPSCLIPLIAEYMWLFLEEGMLVDVKGAAAKLNMFVDAAERWDVAWIRSIQNNLISLETVDRVHPYPYLHPNISASARRGTVTLNLDCETDMERLSTYLTRSLSTKNELKEDDLVDCFDVCTQRWRIAEVCANIGNFVWILWIDDYKSDTDKCRLWISNNESTQLAPYRSHYKPKTVEKGRTTCFRLGYTRHDRRNEVETDIVVEEELIE